jgi:hypothetical protein
MTPCYHQNKIKVTQQLHSQKGAERQGLGTQRDDEVKAAIPLNYSVTQLLNQSLRLVVRRLYTAYNVRDIIMNRAAGIFFKCSRKRDYFKGCVCVQRQRENGAAKGLSLCFIADGRSFRCFDAVPNTFIVEETLVSAAPWPKFHRRLRKKGRFYQKIADSVAVKMD